MSLRCPTGPMPARRRCAGEWIAPQESTTSRPRNSCSLPSTTAFTPTQRVPSNRSSLTCVLVEIVRLARLRVSRIAFDELAVLVGQEIIAGELAGLGYGLRMSCPMLPRDAADRDTAVFAVERPVEVEVALDLPEIGQHVLPAPAGSAARFPFIVVGRRAAIGQLAIDRGAAAQHARLLIFAQGRAFLGVVVADELGRDLELGPVEARIEIGQARIAVQNLGRLVAGRCVLSRLAEQDLVGAAGGEPVGQDRSGGAPAYNDVVIHVRRFPLFLSWEGSAAPSSGHASRLPARLAKP